MSRLVESLRLDDGVCKNIEYHNARMNRSRREVFGAGEPLDLRDYLPPSVAPGVVKCRIVYGPEVGAVTWEAYRRRQIRSLKLVEDDEIDYRFKYEDRSALDALFGKRGEADNVLIVKRGRVTDTAFSNVLLFDGAKWVTPAEPLLFGTCIARLLDAERVAAEDVLAKDLGLFQKILLVNALMDMDEGIELPANAIIK